MKLEQRSSRLRVLMAVLMAALVGCGSEPDGESVPKASLTGGPAPGSVAEQGEDAVAAVQLQADEAKPSSPAVMAEDPFPEVLVRTSMGNLRIRLNAEKAPETVANFLSNYVDRNFYDSTLIHYVDADFMLAAGGYGVDYEEKESRTPIRFEGNNGLKNLRGTVAMVRHAEYIHSATSQFFINLADNPSLDYQDVEEVEGELRDPATYGYCVFGEVVEGLEVLEKIGATAVSEKPEFPRTPTSAVVVEKIERVR